MATPPLSQRAALTAATAILRDLADPSPCTVSDFGQCDTHDWRLGHEACPQLRLRMLLQELEKQPPIPPYTHLALLALVRGATPKQEVHVRVQINGYAHRGALGLDEEHTAASDLRPFHVDLAHGERVTQLCAEDILEADVCARHLSGVPIDPTHDPK
jgi:hypothetical protein